MSEGRNSLIRRITLRSEVSRASRESGKLKIEERKDGYKDSYDNTPVFYEKNREGKRVPVQIRFYSFGRWLQIALNIGLTVFLPAILAAFVRWIYLEPGETFCEGYRFLYGAAWYVLAGFIAVLYLVKGLRRDIYNHPILYELLPGRKRRLIGTRSDRKIGIISMFGIGQKGKNGKRLTIVGFFGNMGVIGIFLAALLFLVLIGSTASILL